MTRADVIVVGLGAMGSATCFRLAQSGASVIGIDRHQPPHTWGSTHGDTRLTRLAIGEGPAYVPLVLRSHDLWRELEAEAGTDLLTECGGLVLSPGEEPVPSHGAADFFGTTVKSARTYGIEHELLDAAEISHRFPQFRLDGAYRGYYEPQAGYVLPEAAVSSQLDLAARRGAALRFGETVTSVRTGNDGVTVQTSAGTYEAGQVVIAAGPWLPELLDEPSLRGLFTVHRQVLHWFDVDAPHEYEPGRFPVFIWHFNSETTQAGRTTTAGDERPRGFYGFPTVGSTPGVKVATGHYGTSTTPDTVNRSVDPAEQATMHAACIEGRLPGVSARPTKSAVCLYTVTPDSGFVIDTLPGNDRVLIASPCSGHGFKHSAAIGEAIAQRVLDGTSRIDLTPFSLARFGLA